MLEKLHAGELDLGILALPVELAGLEARELYREAFLVALPERHPLAAHATVRVADLKGENLLLLEDGHCLRDQALEVCSRAGVREQQDFRATSLETLRQMVATGAGVTLLPELAGRGAYRSRPRRGAAPVRQAHPGAPRRRRVAQDQRAARGHRGARHADRGTRAVSAPAAAATPAQPQPQAQRVSFAARDGRSLAGLLLAAARPRGALLVNGATGFRREFYLKFATYCAARGYHTLVYDYRGIGASAGSAARGGRGAHERLGAARHAGGAGRARSARWRCCRWRRSGTASADSCSAACTTRGVRAPT